MFTNTSDEKLGVWRDWCSWGWFCPAFTISQGKRVFTFKRPARAWAANFADPFWIEPGDHYLLPVSLLDKAHWVQPEGFDFDQQKVATVSATFTIPADADTKAAGLWTGSVHTSEEFHLDIATLPTLPF